MKTLHKTAALLILTVLAAFALLYMVNGTLATTGGIDFHSYWYSGIFIRQRQDPYRAYLKKLQPKIPVEFIDAPPINAQPIAQSGLANVPANTAPLVLLLSPLSFFSWGNAKLIWMASNLLCIASVIYLMFRTIPKTHHMGRFSQIVLAFIFIALFGTRNTVVNGQTSLLVFVLMLLAWQLADAHPIVAGLLLGLALSKYSLSLPSLLLLLYYRKWITVITGIFVQVIGVLLITVLAGTSPLEILFSYLQILKIHTALPGIHISSLFTNNPTLSFMMPILLTLSVFIYLYKFSQKNTDVSWKNYHIFTALSIWTILVAYHRAYDTLIVQTFLILLACSLTGNEWEINQTQQFFLILFFLGSTIYLCLPASGIGLLEKLFYNKSLLPNWVMLQQKGLVFVLLAQLGLTFYLMRFLKNKPTSGIHNA